MPTTAGVDDVPQPPELLELSSALRGAYRAAWERVQAELQRIVDDPAQFRRVARLRAVQARIVDDMDQLDVIARQWLRSTMPQIYETGASTMARSLGESFQWTQTHTKAVSAIAADTFGDLLDATDNVRDSTKRLIRRLSKEGTLSKLIEGKTALQASRAVRREIEKRGVYAVIYRDGSKHGIAEYSNMVLRTKTAVAYNSGSLVEARMHGITHMEVFDGTGCGWIGHNDPDTANGTVRTIEECSKVSISHPNCTRSFGPRPDVKTAPERRRATNEARKTAREIENINEQAALARRDAREASDRRARRRSQSAAARRDRRVQMRSPKQVAHDMLRTLRVPANEITRDVAEITREAGGQMAGMRSRFKTEKSLAGKIERDIAEAAVRLTPARAGEAIADAVRFTSVAGPTKLLGLQDDVLGALEARGHTVTKLKNTWKPNVPYNGINVQMRGPTGVPYELQFHTPESLKVKAANHDRYDKSRELSTSEAERRRLNTASARANARMTVPRGARQRVGQWKLGDEGTWRDYWRR